MKDLENNSTLIQLGGWKDDDVEGEADEGDNEVIGVGKIWGPIA